MGPGLTAGLRPDAIGGRQKHEMSRGPRRLMRGPQF